ADPGDQICIGYHSNNSTQTVNTLLESNVPVTSSHSILEKEHNGLLCKLKGKAPLDLIDCSLPAWLMGNPKCDELLTASEWAYIKEDPEPENGICFPGDFDSLEDLILLVSNTDHFRKEKIIDMTRFSDVTTNNVDSACPYDTNGASFYRNLNWVQQNKGKQLIFHYQNSENNPLLIIWGVHQTSNAAEQNTYYGSQTGSTTITIGEETNTYPLVISESSILNGHSDRINYFWGVVNPNQNFSIVSTGNFIWPEYGYFFQKTTNISGIIKSSEKISDCDTICQTKIGAINSTLPFQNIHQNAIGDCPKYVKAQELVLATGLRNNPIKETRGLFGAIAGFIEGGWQGLIDGWYGYHHQNSEGSGYAADKEATQKAVDAITTKVNNIIDKMNTQFESTAKEFNKIEMRIKHLSDRVDDGFLDVWSYNAELLVLLENERTLDFHDANVNNLYQKVKVQLKDNAIDMGNGCFKILHKCNNTCMDDIKNGTYNYYEYRKESHLEKQKIDSGRLVPR
uniref:Hemagglutinin n=3 Tax=Influenza A virus TaxID=11320 RepID=UPI0003B7DFFC|nr:Chain A, Hemagglutinin [Influenza A virus]4MC5_B Chain B, Hemagglutinin [Influenza A virus]4MC5_C Chain C, Hemagglutinin [Influenza A virus]